VNFDRRALIISPLLLIIRDRRGQRMEGVVRLKVTKETGI